MQVVCIILSKSRVKFLLLDFKIHFKMEKEKLGKETLDKNV